MGTQDKKNRTDIKSQNGPQSTIKKTSTSSDKHNKNNKNDATRRK
ncbi:hypothetical protein QRD02_13940 [Aequorivita sp. SDUM287046]|uniref:Uncharacterized protein n=1 Tax=Aequorivita aurantiaca TaxID=3053356 RepID=A0ABT8DJD2_9FLAO|nr:hypothetical protein [Aequorivita aurantiaca]MDN3725486.1 hypothetical protein [Aequorivita aurantiaca]